MVVRWATAKSMVPWYKMFIEQFVYWSYFTNAYYHAVLGALRRRGPARLRSRLLWDTLKAQWAFWIPAQLINFRFVPVRHQLNFVLVVSLFWTTFLSLAFPPEPQPVVQKQNVVLAEETAPASRRARQCAVTREDPTLPSSDSDRRPYVCDVTSSLITI